jgi:hypothetical protein
MTLLPLMLTLSLGGAPKTHVSLGKVVASEAAAAVTTELKTHLTPLEGCFDLAIKDEPKLAGTVTLTFTVEPEGGVTSITASDDSVKNDTLVQCTMARLRAGKWPVKKAPLTVTASLKYK